MDGTEPVAMLMDSTTSKIQRLQRAFAELESQRALTLNLKWEELEEHFRGLEKSLKRRFHELEDQEKEFETKTRRAREILQRREEAVVAKEQTSLKKLQGKRDAAVSAITNALENHRKVPYMEPAVLITHKSLDSPTVEEKDNFSAQSSLEDPQISSEIGNLEVNSSYPQLFKLCEEMDYEGLHKFISDNRKNLAALREEIPFALQSAANPADLVLNSLKDFYPTEVSNADVKKDSYLLGLRRTCIMLMECLSILLTYTDLISVPDVITEDIKVRAKTIAEEWKPMLDVLDSDSSNGNSLEAHAFLQLLATFDLASDFDEEKLSRLIPMVSRRRQAADLCRYLGLADKMPGVIEVLVNNGRQIDAVNLAFAFELTEKYLPIPLLKSYLKEASKMASLIKQGNTSTGRQNEVNERELAALKAVTKCIEEHKLEDQFPVEALLKRTIQLEKAKADKKRETEAAKPQPKRPRANGIGCGPLNPNNAADKTFYTRVVDRYPQVPQYMYETPYMYSAPADNNHFPSLVSSAASYGFSPNNGNYFGNGYHQYQYQAPYLH